MAQTTLRSRPLVTNGFIVETPNVVDLVVRDMSSPSDVKAERERLKDFWSLHWAGGGSFTICGSVPAARTLTENNSCLRHRNTAGFYGHGSMMSSA